ncbi:lysophospholipid acyltransferase family protein [Roseibium aggregatum]|uniref:Lysophospholipid acyltransferase family protein n=1 Tax=Roseibium aggregatum TaxID=187304 RepID=A0A939E914_9HYPH|nr:lysophospholipid acyltransferase family protein [Roseibium aggregatum]MBN9669106.1 lysophospholipid acyltransferase family protein [Roseibium aggregatum]
MIKRLGRHPRVLSAVGSLMAAYLKLVYHTNRFVIEPVDAHDDTEKDLPVIVAMWHGQHFMVPFAKPRHWPAKVMISRSADGEVNAVAASKFGLGLIRASGGKNARQIRKRGGMRGFIEALRALKDGYSIAMTADVPKGPSRKSGEGIVQLAKHSGRPILPVAVATSRSIELDTWDRASVNLPFGRGSIAISDLIWVPAETEDDALESYRLKVEDGLNAATKRAYELVGRSDG